MSRQNRRRAEEGQVYPALLLAICGGLALAVLFVVIQNLLDQTGRSDTAADSAALAAAREHRDEFTGSLGAGGAAVKSLLGFLSGESSWGQAPGARDAAEEYAKANGATVTDFRFEGFDLSERRWTYFVETQQKDEVENADGGDGAQTKSTALASVTLAGGLCDGGLGIEGPGGECLTSELLDLLEKCEEEESDPGDSKGGKPKKDKPDPECKELDDQPSLDDLPGLDDLLDFRVQLVNES